MIFMTQISSGKGNTGQTGHEIFEEEIVIRVKTVKNVLCCTKFSSKYLKIVQNFGNPTLLLIENSANRELWIKALNGPILIDMAHLIQENARAKAEEFNNLIAEQLWESPETLLILTRTFERNTLVSKLFQDYIYVITGIQALQTHSRITVITDRIGVANDIFNSSDFNIPIKLNKKEIKFKPQVLGDLLRIIKFCLWFTGNLLSVRNLTSPNAKVIIHSFADRKTKITKQYEERYFPGLFGKFKEAGHEPSMLISNAGTYPKKLWSKLIDNGMNPTLEFKYLKLSIIFLILWQSFKMRKPGQSDFRVSGISLKETFKQNFQESRFELGTFQAITRYYSLQNLISERTLTEKIFFLCEYEGMQLEKAAALVRNRFSENFNIIGIQHGTIFSNLLCFFPTNWELEKGMLPNKIVCNGIEFKRILSSAKIPQEILEVGPALRYSFLHEHSGMESRSKGNKIFVPLSLTRSQEVKTIEFIEQALAFSSFQVLSSPIQSQSVE